MAHFDMGALDGGRTYKLLTSVVVPRPIAWTVTKDRDGCINAAPFSLFNFFGGTPPVVCIGMGNREGSPKDTLANMQANGEFVINLVTHPLLDAMNTTAVPFPPACDEIARAGLTTAPSTAVSVPRIAESPVALECRLWQVIPLDPSNNLVLGHVVGLHVDDAMVVNAEKCYLDGTGLDTVGRMQSPGWYTRTHERFALRQMSLAEWNAKQA